VKATRFFLALTLIGITFNTFAKEAISSGASKPLANVNKHGQRDVSPGMDSDFKRYLRWHRDAIASRGREEGVNASNRQPFLQL
jgi:hypothetical protein